ncbi:MAG: fructosamine kinase family protein, partial [Anaerolineae bacterium]|nr:fructosamine kinase family protein [Anaerolineae bacterium]
MLNMATITDITGSEVKQSQRLSGGMIGDVYRITLNDGRLLVAKSGAGANSMLDIEGRMLRYLREHSQFPVPEVVHSDPNLLLMTYIDNQGSITAQVQEEAGRIVAQLHSISSEMFGLEFDTLIGALHQPNLQYERWIDFFREQRLLYMADVAHQAGQLSDALRHRIDTFAPRLDSLLQEPTRPALIHGDMWTGNVLCLRGHLAGFVDPAIYYAHPEIELAFTTLFGTFGRPFFQAYQEIHPLEPGFFEERRDIYNLYPLLVHVRLF